MRSAQDSESEGRNIRCSDWTQLRIRTGKEEVEGQCIIIWLALEVCHCNWSAKWSWMFCLIELQAYDVETGPYIILWSLWPLECLCGNSICWGGNILEMMNEWSVKKLNFHLSYWDLQINLVIVIMCIRSYCLPV